MSGDVTKLPKWAQDRIGLLERNVAYWKDLADGKEAGRTHLWISDVGEMGYIPIRDGGGLVTFAINCDPKSYHDRFDVRLDGRILVVSAGDGLRVYPQSSNVIKIEHSR